MSVLTGMLRRRGSPGPRLVVVLVLLLLILLLLPVSPAARIVSGSAAVHTPATSAFEGQASGWTTLGGSENRSGYTTSVGATVDQLLWEECLGSGAIRTGPVVSAGAVYVATTSGWLYELNRSDGPVGWSAFVGSDPTTADGSGPQLIVGSADGNLSALSESNGSLLWSRSVPGGVTQGIGVAAGTAYVATTRGDVLAVSLSNGSAQWSVSVGAPISGAIALQSGSVYLSTSNGTVISLSDSTGSVLWERGLGSPVVSAPAVFGGLVVVGDASGNVSALSASDGAVEWRWSARSLLPHDSISSTPSLSPGRVVVATDLGQIDALNASSGRLLWNQSTPNSGYPVLAGPVTTPGLVYAVGGATLLEATEVATGEVAWSTSLDGGSASFSPIAVVGQELLVGDDAGCVADIGSPSGPSAWPVEGVVLSPSGGPVQGAEVSVNGIETTTGPGGAFQFELVNGTYDLTVDKPGYIEGTVPVTVDGPHTNLSIVLRPLPLFLLDGTVTDQDSGLAIAGAVVDLQGADGYEASTVTSSHGAFEILAGNGTDSLLVLPPSGYGSTQVAVTVDGAPVSGVDLQVEPTGLAIPGSDPYRLDLVLPLGSIALAALAVGVVGLRERRRESGLSPALFSRFAEYVAMRLALIPGEVAAVLLILYVFGTFLPAAASGENLCALSSVGCSACTWSNPGCVVSAFGSGFGTFLVRLVTGDWGFASYGPLTEPAARLLAWWLPDSVELALVALALSVAIAYPVSILSSARPDSPADVGSRLGSTVGLLVPSFLVLLAVYGLAYEGFVRTLGDSPYGLVPTPVWLGSHGGVPSWVGIAGNTSPTGFPIVDSLLHQDWGYASLAIVKTLLQASVIALIYVAIYLRHLRGVIARALTSPAVVAARARGLSERTILWRHGGRSLLPTYLLVFGSTIPAYIGAQALVEAISNDTGLGTLLLTEVVRAPSTGFGFTHGVATSGNFYQVAIFLVVLLVLATRLAADVVARYLDPRLLEEAPH